MSQRRLYENDVPMFVTTNVQSRRKLFSDAAYANEAVEHMYRVQLVHPFLLYGFVIMPDHCHFLLHVLSPEKISRIMNAYKAGLAHQIGIGPIWQTRYYVRIAHNLPTIIEYIHLNPVRAGIVTDPGNYLWSSASGKWDVTPLY